MKVSNMVSSRGNKVANQFIIEGAKIGLPELNIALITGRLFQSYDSNIAFISMGQVYLDKNYWDYSVTTGKYRNQFLGEGITETRKKIESGEYRLVDLN